MDSLHPWLQVRRRQSRLKNHEHARSVHVSWGCLQQEDHLSNLRLTGAYIFLIFVVSESVPGQYLVCFVSVLGCSLLPHYQLMLFVFVVCVQFAFILYSLMERHSINKQSFTTVSLCWRGWWFLNLSY
jgi:hypothetical protein